MFQTFEYLFNSLKVVFYQISISLIKWMVASYNQISSKWIVSWNIDVIISERMVKSCFMWMYCMIIFYWENSIIMFSLIKILYLSFYKLVRLKDRTHCTSIIINIADTTIKVPEQLLLCSRGLVLLQNKYVWSTWISEAVGNIVVKYLERNLCSTP